MNRHTLPTALLLAAAPVALAGDEVAQLFAADAALEDQFGFAVAVDGAFAVVGALYDDDRGLYSGSAYLFDATTGQQLAKLLPLDGDDDDRFGSAVAIEGTTVVVGAPYDEHPSGTRCGAVYLFEATTGQQLAKLSAADGGTYDYFGHSVAIDGGLVAVGAFGHDHLGPYSGAVYVFDAATGQQRAELLAADGVEGDALGWGVDIQGSTVAAGAPFHVDSGVGAGSAYLFDVATGQQLVKLLALDGAVDDRFGRSVAIDGGLVLVGAERNAANGVFAGAAYLFEAASGQQTQKLLAQDGEAYDRFGLRVALDGVTALVGAREHDGVAYRSGAAYLFDARTGEQTAKLLPSDGGSADRFGAALDLRDGAAIVGAIHAQTAGVRTGRAYLFELPVPYCPGDDSGTACPCGNPGAPGHGCANSVFPTGARLAGLGLACVGDDELALSVSGSTPDQPGLFFQADDATNGGSGVPFGDGLCCAEGNVLGLEVVYADAAGGALTSVGIAAQAGVLPGDTKRYQWRYRDPLGGPCGSGFNLSNGVELTWVP